MKILKYKKILIKIIVAVTTFIIININSIGFAQSVPPEIKAEYAIAMDRQTKKIMYDKNAQEKMYPASTTKIWTAYLVVKNIKNLDEKIAVKKDYSYVEPSSMYLKIGEEFTVRDLLQVLMLKSANDVAVLLAEHVSGSVEEFSKLMNKEAKKIGCLNTNFTNPNGLPDENHYSTAQDIVLMGIQAIKNKDINRMVMAPNIKIPATKQSPYERVYRNSNKFINGVGKIEYKGELINSKYDIVSGLKSGYTNSAGRCLVTTAEKEGRDVIVGVFKSKGDYIYSDSRALLDYSYDNYQTQVLIDSSKLNISKKIPHSKQKNLEGYIAKDYLVTTLKGESLEEFNYKVHFEEVLSLPIKKDKAVGEIEIFKNDKLIDRIKVYSKDDVESIYTFLEKYKQEMIILGTLCFVFTFSITRKRKRKQIKIKKIKIKRKRQ